MSADGLRGPKPAPIVGNARQFQRDRLEFLLECSRNYGPIVPLRLGPRRAYLLNEPDDARAVLVEQADQFHKTPLFKKNTALVIGQGLLTSEDELHARQRRLMQPAFRHQDIAGYGELMVEYTQRMLATWQDGETRDLHHDMVNLTMGIISQSLFGADVSTIAEDVGEAISSGLKIVVLRSTRPFNPPDWLPTPMNLKSRRNLALLNRVILGMIEQRRASGAERPDLLAMILAAVDDEAAGGMSDQQARDEVMTLFIAGHETTANALAWTLMLLAQNPAAAETFYAEVEAALGKRRATFADLPGLIHTEMVVRESMRLYPPAWIIPRQAMDDVVIGATRIARGDILFISPYSLHRDPRFFPEPERFMPERFAPGYEDRIPRYAYLPFGGGPRVCIGNGFAMMEARLILATLAQHYRFALVPGQDLTPDPLVTLRPKYGLRMTLSQREPMPAA